MRTSFISMGVLLVMLLSACEMGATPEPTPTETPQPTATTAPTNTPEPTATPQPTETPEPAAAPGYDAVSAYAGAWSGEWVNETFGSSGSAEAEVTVNEDGTLSVTVDLGGSVFGMGDPNPITFQGSYDEDSARVGVEAHPMFGTFELSVVDDSLAVKAENIPVEQISGMEVTGSLTPGELDADYVIHFPDGSAAQGTLNLSHGE